MIQLQKATRKHSRTGIWTALILGLWTAAVLGGCGSLWATRTQPEADVAPALASTPIRTRLPTITPTLVPMSTPTPAASPTATPTPLPLPTFTPTAVPSPTLIPMLALSVTPEVPTTQGHTESAQTVVASGHEEGQAEAAKPSADAVPQRTLVLSFCPTPHFLASVTPLTHLTLRLEGIDQMRCLSQNLHRHDPDLTQLRVELEGLQGLTDEVLPGSPHMTHLTLDVAGVAALTSRLLSQFPNLVSLHLHDSSDGWRSVRPELVLSETFFSHAPNLTDLSLRLDRLTQMASNLLEPVPNLQQLQLIVGLEGPLPNELLVPVPNLQQLQLIAGPEGSLPDGLLAPVSKLERFSVSVETFDAIPIGFLDDLAQLTELSIQFRHYYKYGPSTPLSEDFQIDTPRLEIFSLSSDRLASLPDNLLPDTAKLTHLHLNLPNLQEWPSSFLMHTPALEFLEMQYGYGTNGKEIQELHSVPPHFLTQAPNLIHLNLGAADGVQELPAGFLANSPKLEYLDLAVNVTELPEDFLAQHPQLKTLKLFVPRVTKVPDDFLVHVSRLRSLELDLRQVDALPTDFLEHTPLLGYLKLDVDQVDALPNDFLSYTPRLGHLYVRAANVVSLPENFLGYSPRIETLGLGMPSVALPPGPGDTLWDTLQAASFRVKVTAPEVQVKGDGYFCPVDGKVVERGDILEVVGREQDSMGNTLLSVFHWWNRDLFFSFYERHWCLFSIDARYTEPTLDL